MNIFSCKKEKSNATLPPGVGVNRCQDTKEVLVSLSHLCYIASVLAGGVRQLAASNVNLPTKKVGGMTEEAKKKKNSLRLPLSLSPRLFLSARRHTHTASLNHHRTRYQSPASARDGRQLTKPQKAQSLSVFNGWMSPKMEANGGVGAGAVADCSIDSSSEEAGTSTERCGEHPQPETKKETD